MSYIEKSNCNIDSIINLNRAYLLNKYGHNLINLQNINLKNNEIQTIDPETFKGLTALESINLNNNEIQAIDPETFRGLNNLKTIENFNLFYIKYPFRKAVKPSLKKHLKLKFSAQIL